MKDWGSCNKDCPMRRYLSNRDIQDIISNLALSNPTLAQTYNLTHRYIHEKISFPTLLYPIQP